MFPVFINRARVNKNIININNCDMIEGVENIIHDVLKLTGGILKTKQHNIPLIMSKRSGKSSFVPIIFTNLDLLDFMSNLENTTASLNLWTGSIFIGNRISNPFQNLI